MNRPARIAILLAAVIAWPATSAAPARASSGSARSPVAARGRAVAVLPRAVKVPHVSHAIAGKPAGTVYVRGYRATLIKQSPDPGNMTYNGGPVQQSPVVYIDFWGTWWASTGNPGGGGSDVEGDLYSLFHGLGLPSDSWSATMSQYPDSAGHRPGFGGGVWGKWVNDNSSDPPQAATNNQLAAEAASMADYWGVAGDTNVQIVVVSPSGDNPGGGFNVPNGYCGWHDVTTDPSGNPVVFTNLPYVPDAGSFCGANSVSNYLDGVSIVEGHEFAESITDPGAEYPAGKITGAWYDGPGSSNPDYAEIGDKCAWYGLGDVTLSTGAFPMQPLWSNASSSCALAARPAVGRLSVASGPAGGGTSLTVYGSNLAGGSVSFGSKTARNVSCGATSCSVRSPSASLGIYDVRVATAGGTSAVVRADKFTYFAGPGHITGYRGRCLSDKSNSTANGAKIVISACSSSARGQKWEYWGNHTLHVVGKCLTVTRLSAGAKAVLGACSGSRRQTWRANSVPGGRRAYVNPASGKCLTDPRNSVASGTQIVLEPCKGRAGQHWSYP